MRKLRAGMLGAIVGAVVGSVAMAGGAQAAELFSPTGPWNSPIPANPPTEPTSTAQISALATEIELQAAGLRPDYPYFAQTSYSTPIYSVTAATPKQALTIDDRSTKNRLLQKAIDASGGVPFPKGAQPAQGSDGHITVLDTTSKVLYEFWRASSPEQNAVGCVPHVDWSNLLAPPAPCHGDGKWHAETGGIMDEYDSDPGHFSSNSWPGLTSDQGWRWGATATSLPKVAGIITFEDMQAGVIDHAVAGNMPGACRDYVVYPAQRNDGRRTGPTCIPEGARLQLDPAYDVEADSNPPLTKAVERAAQRYGIIIRDVTNDNFGFYGQDPQTHPRDPWRRGPGVGGVANGNRGYLGGERPSELFRGFPWRRLRVIAARHCATGPCHP